MATTYTLISSNIVGSGGASNVTFSSIPTTYTDLLLKCSSRLNGSTLANGFLISFNGSSSTFTHRLLQGNGTSVISDSGVTGTAGLDNGALSTASTFSNTEIYIANYLSGNYKTYSSDSITETNATTMYSEMVAGLWSTTSSINQITIAPDSGSRSYVQYSSFYLYGIKNS